MYKIPQEDDHKEILSAELKLIYREGKAIGWFPNRASHASATKREIDALWLELYTQIGFFYRYQSLKAINAQAQLPVELFRAPFQEQDLEEWHRKSAFDSK